MGFGLLFIGYFIAYLGAFLPQISLFTYVLGSGVILFSLRKLIYENKLFIASASVAILLELASIISLGIKVFAENNTAMLVATIFLYIAEACVYALNILLMLAISCLAREVGLKRLSIMPIVNIVFVGLGGVFFVLTETITSQAILLWLTPIYVVIKLAYSIFSLIIIFNSYMRICYEGDEKMQKETTGIAIFDKLNSLTNKAYSFKNNKGDKKK